MGTFADAIGDWVEHVDLKMSMVVRKVAFDVYGGVVKRTPVDTGHARGNWRAVVGAGPPPSDEIDRDIKHGLGVAQEREQIRKFRVGKNDKVFIFNNTSYIVYLDRGSSGQNRQGIVSPVLTAIIAAAESGGHVEFTDVSKGGL
jgi:hypothetical protein